MEFITAKEAAKKWGITPRRVQILCSEGRIEGAWRLGNVWAIPLNAPKPEDGRILRRSGEEDDNAVN